MGAEFHKVPIFLMYHKFVLKKGSDNIYTNSLKIS